MTNPICSVNACTNKLQAKGFCTTHLARLKKGTDLNSPIQVQKRRTSNQCSFKSCKNPYHCKGLCAFHYKRQKAGIPLDSPKLIHHPGSIEKTCPWCDGMFYVKNSGKSRKYCSRKCSQSSKRGSQNQNWKGGITAENASERNRFSRDVRELVFKRDNFTCQICDIAASGRLHVDHIKRWSEYPELRFDIDNCRTVCTPCHYFITFKRSLPEGSRWGQKKRLRI